MDAKTSVGPDQNQEPGVPSRSPMRVPEAKALGPPSTVFLGALAGIQAASGTVGLKVRSGGVPALQAVA